MVRLSRVAPEVPVSDLERALRFYEEKLGFSVAMELPEARYAIVERDAVAIHLFHEERAAHTPVALHIFTDQLEELRQELQRRGACVSQEIERKPWGNRDFRVTDDSGNQIKFTEPISETA